MKNFGTLRKWAAAIAWMQIVVYIIGFIFSLIGLIHDVLWIVHISTNDTANMSDSSLKRSRNSELFSFSTSLQLIKIQIFVFIAVFAVILVICCIGIAFGIVLLRGVRQNNVLCLRRWRNYAIFWLGCYLIFTVIVVILKWWSWSLVALIVPLLIFGFCITIVSIFMTRIEQRGDNPQKSQDNVDGEDQRSNAEVQERHGLQPLSRQSPAAPQSQPEPPYNPFYS